MLYRESTEKGISSVDPDYPRGLECQRFTSRPLITPMNDSLNNTPGTEQCRSCGRSTRTGWTFVFRPSQAVGAQATIKCGRCGPRHWPMLRRSLMVAVVVGTVLTLLNQGDDLLSGQWNNALYWKIPLTYCVPFLVATYGALTAARR